ncbi:MAG: response regulator, partial [Nitrospinae bacterium]|nr:response regulator [Nitrospinota bacterium]
MNTMASELIYIVDDDAPLRRLIKTLLEDQGHSVKDFESGTSLLKELDNSPSLILLDVMMPGIDGLETLERIKSSRPDLPVIMLTSADRVETAVDV